MKCDGVIGCPNQVMRAPALMVPHKAVPFGVQYPPRRMFTEWHYCELHASTLDCAKLAQNLLVPRVKADFEKIAKLKWPMGYTCDFEQAYIRWFLVTTPEYRQFLAALGYHGIMGAAKLNSAEQQAERVRLGVTRLAG